MCDCDDDDVACGAVISWSPYFIGARQKEKKKKHLGGSGKAQVSL